MVLTKRMTKTIAWAFVIVWMAVIFYLSHQPATESDKLSTGITEIIVENVQKVLPQNEFDMNRLNHVVRKNAHFFAYLLLGIFVLHALTKSGVLGFKAFFIALGICVLYAISDEVHQLFVPGRSGQVRDVLIDSTGALVGIGLYLCVKNIRKQKGL